MEVTGKLLEQYSFKNQSLHNHQIRFCSEQYSNQPVNSTAQEPCFLFTIYSFYIFTKMHLILGRKDFDFSCMEKLVWIAQVLFSHKGFHLSDFFFFLKQLIISLPVRLGWKTFLARWKIQHCFIFRFLSRTSEYIFPFILF